jgi:hypothetical protein
MKNFQNTLYRVANFVVESAAVDPGNLWPGGAPTEWVVGTYAYLPTATVSPK